MSYDFNLEIKKNQEFDFHTFKIEIEQILLLAGEELIFGDISFNQDLRDFHFKILKAERKFRNDYYNYLKKKGIEVSFFDKLIGRINNEQAYEYIDSCIIDNDFVNVLTICTHPTDESHLIKIFEQIKDISKKYNLLIYDPQVGKHIDLDQELLKGFFR